MATSPLLHASANGQFPQIGDVALTPTGDLHGQVQYPSNSQNKLTVTGRNVALFRANKPIATTTADKHGRFTFNQLSGGVYQLRTGVRSFTYRVWTPQTAPPHALQVVTLSLADTVIRGQRSIPAFTLRQASIATAVLGGAIAAPSIYNNLRRTNRIPVSP